MWQWRHKAICKSKELRIQRSRKKEKERKWDPHGKKRYKIKNFDQIINKKNHFCRDVPKIVGSTIDSMVKTQKMGVFKSKEGWKKRDPLYK